MTLFIYWIVTIYVIGSLSHTTNAYSCPSGYDCISEQICTNKNVECSTGMFCTGDYNSFGLCPAEYYCESASTIALCPSGHFCKSASIAPAECEVLSICGEGSMKDHTLLYLVIAIFVTALLVVLYNIRTYRQRRAQAIDLAMMSIGLSDSQQIEVRGERTKMTFNLRFENLGLVMKGKKKDKVILEGVTGDFRAGQVSAIMGPSGSGKTTLVNILCSKVKNTSGKIFINGVEESMSQYSKLVGYVPQDDIMLRTLTVRQVLQHSARIRLPSSWTEHQKMQLVDEVIILLKLKHIENSVIGDEANRGISGGERKRVNIGIELVADPFILFLDEPTSGLDSSTSKEIMAFLRRIAHRGINVITVIHQPRYEIVQMCDNLMLLAKGGRTVFLGSVDHALEYFTNIGFACPPYVNPTDHFIDVISGKINKGHNGIDYRKSAKDMLMSSVEEPVSTKEKEIVASDLVALWEDYSSQNQKKDAELSDTRGDAIRKTPNFVVQMWWFLHRSFLLFIGDKKGLLLEISYQLLPGISLGITVLTQELYVPPLPEEMTQACPLIIRDKCGTEMLQSSATTVFFVTMVLGAAATVSGVRSFGEPNEKSNFYREYNTGMSSLAFFVAKNIFDLFNILRNTWEFLMIYMLMSSPPGDKVSWFLATYSLSFCGFGVGYFFSSFMEADKALVVSVVTGVTMAVTSGLSPKLSDIANIQPLPVIWGLSYCRWNAEALYLTLVGSWPYMNVDVATKAAGYEPGNFGLGIGMCFVIGIAWRVAAYFMLRLSARNHK